MKRTPLARMSKRRKRESVEYMKLRKQFLEANPVCMVALEVEGIALPTCEIHHKFCGGNRRATYLRTDTWIACSKFGHRFIHDNPKLAYERGWLLKKIPPILN